MIIRDYNQYEGYLSHRFTTQALLVIRLQELWSRTFRYRLFYSFYPISSKVQNTNANKIQKSQFSQVLLWLLLYLFFVWLLLFVF